MRPCRGAGALPGLFDGLAEAGLPLTRIWFRRHGRSLGAEAGEAAITLWLGPSGRPVFEARSGC